MTEKSNDAPLYGLYTRFMHEKKTRYSYYDTPDGEDLLLKLKATTRLGIKCGLFYGGVATLLRSTGPRSHILQAYDIIRRGFPFVLFAVAYTTSTYSLTKMREKDEPMNAYLGGAIGGLLFGVWHRNGVLASVAAIIGSIGCGMRKKAHMDGVPFIAPDRPRIGGSSWFLRNMDFSLLPDDQE